MLGFGMIVEPSEASALAALGGLILWRTWPNARGTTLAAPFLWAGGALVALIIAQALIVRAIPEQRALPWWSSHVRYLAATLTLAPGMALLGAKRPQDRAWQFVVLGLLAVLWVPCGQAWLFAPHEPFRCERGFAWLLGGLWTLQLLNHVPTRFAPAALLVAVGQWLLLAPHWPLWPSPSGPEFILCGTAALLAALGVAWCSYLPAGAQSLDRIWIDFRDAYGLLWGLRVLERFNATAAQQGWPVHLGWSGLAVDRPRDHTDEREPTDEQLKTLPTPASADLPVSREVPAGARRALDNLLLRFVSPAWLASRENSERDS